VLRLASAPCLPPCAAICGLDPPGELSDRRR
jgi:hypothetical protein